MVRVAEVIRGWMGWCPCSRQGTAAPVTRPVMAQDDTGQQLHPLRKRIVWPSGFTALSLAILIATCVFGGQAWWPAFVLGVTIAGIIAMASRQGQESV